MAIQYPGPEATPPPPPPPAIGDRRAPERRGEYQRRAEDRVQFARTAAAAAMAICGGLAVLFVFFWALGAIDVKEAAGATVVACLFALVWLAGFLYRRQHEEAPTIQRDRERRGF
jgi:Na+-driven multidrug efflux pump